MSMYYEVGNLVQFLVGEEIHTAAVIARVDRLWDGQPGFIGDEADDIEGGRVWGLDREILAVGIITDEGDDNPRKGPQ